MRDWNRGTPISALRHKPVPPPKTGPGALTIAAGVFLGLIFFTVTIWLLAGTFA